MQLPHVVGQAVFAWFQAANVGTSAYPFLTMGNANLLLAHGSRSRSTPTCGPMLEGRWFGTMCLSEPQAGSSLADITTRAEPAGRRHLPADRQQDVDLRRRPRADREHRPPGAGQDPRRSARREGHLAVHRAEVPGRTTTARSGERNDVVLAGLNHKMGYRGTTNTLLNFGEGVHTPGRAGRRGRLPGRRAAPRPDLHVPHDERGADRRRPGRAVLGYTGYLHALDYARTRTQGRPGRRARTRPRRRCRSSSTPTCAGCCWPQKSYVEGGAGARPVLRAAGRRGADRRDRGRAGPRAPAARRC